jgi:5-formyltetrahydrofolate cyclo-ligase
LQAREDPHPTAEAVLSAHIKQQFRKDAAALRARLAAAVPDFAARLAAFADGLRLPAGAVVSGYAAVRDEADPRALLLALAAKGHPIALPRIERRDAPLCFHIWKTGDAMRSGVFGIEEPLQTAQQVYPHVLFVPLLAFDAVGHRLGYGGGYYDRTLEALRARCSIRAIGVAYVGQEVASLPAADHDQRLDAVITESGLHTFPRQ